MKKTKILIVLTILSAFNSANAATTTAPMQITAIVAAKCNLTATNMNFASVQPTSSTTNATTNSNFGVECTKDTPYSVTFDMGLYPDSLTNSRRVKNSSTSDYLTYSMSVGGTILNNSSASISGTGQGIGTINSQVINGNLIVAGNVAPGNYSDTVTITVTY